MALLKIMVNFSARKVITTSEHRGSREFASLINKGYREVATCRAVSNSEVEAFVTSEYFDPADKYQKPNNDETIQA